MKPQRAQGGQNENVVKEAAEVPSFQEEYTRRKGCSTHLFPHTWCCFGVVGWCHWGALNGSCRGKKWEQCSGRVIGAFSLVPAGLNQHFWSKRQCRLLRSVDLIPDRTLCQAAGWNSRCRPNLHLWDWPPALQNQMFLWFVLSCSAAVAQSEWRNSALNMKHQPRSPILMLPPDTMVCIATYLTKSAACAVKPQAGRTASPLISCICWVCNQHTAAAAEQGPFSFIFGSPRSQRGREKCWKEALGAWC